MVRAKVFISCGQRRDTDEVEVARRIAERLYRDGYEPYIAVEEQTLKGLKERERARCVCSFVCPLGTRLLMQKQEGR